MFKSMVPVTQQAHGKKLIKTIENFEFAKNVNMATPKRTIIQQFYDDMPDLDETPQVCGPGSDEEDEEDDE